MLKYILALILLCTLPQSQANTFIGQWHVFDEGENTVAQTIDGYDKLRIEVSAKQQVRIVLVLQDFASFSTTDNILEYASPIYGRIRTGNYHLRDHAIIIDDTYEVNRFIQNLCDISTHVMLAAENMGYSFTERKVAIAYVDNNDQPQLKRSQFSTVEIDEVLEQLGINE